MAISNNQYQTMANKLGNSIDPAAVKAVAETESQGNGFLLDGRPIILFEGHDFWKNLEREHLNPHDYEKGNEDILFKHMDRTKYKGGALEWDRMNKARKINETAALKSASYGAFQIMGDNCLQAGYPNVADFVNSQNTQEGQINAFLAFVKFNHLDKYLERKDWAGFARHYNGKRYKIYNYDKQIETRYNTYKSEFESNGFKTLNMTETLERIMPKRENASYLENQTLPTSTFTHCILP